MKSKVKRPKISILHDEIPPHVQEFMHLTRLAEMGRLAANVAHEINNPLMVAQGFAENIELLLDEPELARDEIRMQVLEIIKSCQRVSRIVNKMNRMSRSQKLRLLIVDIAPIRTPKLPAAGRDSCAARASRRTGCAPQKRGSRYK